MDPRANYNIINIHTDILFQSLRLSVQATVSMAIQYYGELICAK